MLIDPTGHALLDSTGRQLTSLTRPCPPTATMVVGLVQPYSPTWVISSPAHTSRPAITGVASSSPHTAEPASARSVLSSAHAARPASKLGPAQARAAYSHLLEQFLAVVWASQQLPPVSNDVDQHIVTHGPHPSLPSFKNWTARSWRLQSEVQAAGGGQHYSAFHFSQVWPALHGEEGGWQLVFLQRFPLFQPGDRAGCLPVAAGLRRQSSRLHSFLQD
jgi:hypothetical protein